MQPWWKLFYSLSHFFFWLCYFIHFSVDSSNSQSWWGTILKSHSLETLIQLTWWLEYSESAWTLKNSSYNFTTSRVPPVLPTLIVRKAVYTSPNPRHSPSCFLSLQTLVSSSCGYFTSQPNSLLLRDPHPSVTYQLN